MTVIDYIEGLVAFEVPQKASDAILFARGIDGEMIASDLTQKQRDLIYADLLMYGITKPSSSGGEKKAHGGFSHTTKSETFTYRDDWFKAAMAIYKKYGDPKYDPGSLVKITNASSRWKRR
ncbi:hypothetical protein M2132_001064 [Dysgonomonas sp. PH5-45]|uniref:hypothetical protein n=1 Tax=unclassified Dysgonomonas TaxID=2630389 RepID=UPI002473C4FC|nr:MULTISPECIES: hypothetical protein [unclassified Dysgonomonas]MDH6354735.1 hypothetical protein [Dysgonomonas sp. PH5-45]MDH6387634.1 hypothetical protein [Dysgonomonas sp. PH5-37]